MEIRTELIEVPVGNVGVSQFSLGVRPNLREAKRIKNIEAFSVDQVTVSPSGFAVINAAVFNKSYIRLINNGGTELKAIPLKSLSKSVNGTTIPDVDVPQIDAEKTVIQVGSTVGLVANEVFLLAITYEK